MNSLVPAIRGTNTAIRSFGGSGELSASEKGSYVNALVSFLWLLTRVLVLLLLFGLLVLTGLVWLWLASFRAGSRFGAWVYSFWEAEPEKNSKLVWGLVYTSIVALLTPLAVFGDWSKQLISKHFPNPFPPIIDLREIIKNHLGIELPEETPCLPKTDSGDPEE